MCKYLQQPLLSLLLVMLMNLLVFPVVNHLNYSLLVIITLNQIVINHCQPLMLAMFNLQWQLVVSHCYPFFESRCFIGYCYAWLVCWLLMKRVHIVSHYYYCYFVIVIGYLVSLVVAVNYNGSYLLSTSYIRLGKSHYFNKLLLKLQLILPTVNCWPWISSHGMGPISPGPRDSPCRPWHRRLVNLMATLSSRWKSGGNSGWMRYIGPWDLTNGYIVDNSC